MSKKGRFWAAPTAKIASRWSSPKDRCGNRKKGRPHEGGYGICGGFKRLHHYTRRAMERRLLRQLVTGAVDLDVAWPLLE